MTYIQRVANLFHFRKIYKVGNPALNIFKMQKISRLLFLLILLSTDCHSPNKAVDSININPYQYSIQKKIVCDNGTVISAHPLASKVGIEILKMGGNAIDAAIATQLALAVVYPGAGNIGGGGFMIARLSGG